MFRKLPGVYLERKRERERERERERAPGASNELQEAQMSPRRPK